METKQIKKNNTPSCYLPKKSRKSPKMNRLPGDSDVWEERVMIHRESGRRRSCFRSKNTDRWTWDEPPSGASKIRLRSICGAKFLKPRVLTIL